MAQKQGISHRQRYCLGTCPMGRVAGGRCVAEREVCVQASVCVYVGACGLQCVFVLGMEVVNCKRKVDQYTPVV